MSAVFRMLLGFATLSIDKAMTVVEVVIVVYRRAELRDLCDEEAQSTRYCHLEPHLRFPYPSTHLLHPCLCHILQL